LEPIPKDKNGPGSWLESTTDLDHESSGDFIGVEEKFIVGWIVGIRVIVGVKIEFEELGGNFIVRLFLLGLD